MLPGSCRAIASGPGNAEKAIDPLELRKAISLSAHYLIRVCDEEGKFVYRINLNPEVIPKPQYNILRHAGTIYALAMYEQRYPNEDTRRALDRAVSYLREKTLVPIPKREDLLAVWSLPTISLTRQLPQAKLGGTGLGLVAFLSMEKVRPGMTSIDELRKMGNFLLFMQKENGSFYSKYTPLAGGRDDRWTSLYYPGEAALGLLMLYEKDPSPKWLQAAANSIAHLARMRSGKSNVEADHWALLATIKLMPVYDCLDHPPLPKKAIFQHAIQICESILAEKTTYSPHATEYGCLTDDGRTCPTATRLEGLLAALTFLPAENRSLRERITSAVTEGISFILRSQVSSGKHAGGIPRAIRPLPLKHPRSAKSFNERATEVRIDYVQHALSAMIQYEQMFYPPPPRLNLPVLPVEHSEAVSVEKHPAK